MNNNNIILIGMPGSGKSTLGVLLAKYSGYSFVDLDLIITKKTGKKLQKILDQDGYDAFLKIENQVGKELDCEKTVVATGGSMVLSAEGMEHLKKIGTVVYINVPIDEIIRRVTNVAMQKGDGAQIEDGDRVCSQGIAISVKDGSELASTWEKNTPDCSTVVTSDTSQMTENYYKIFKSLKLNSTVAFGVNDSNSSGTSYLMVLTLVSKSKALKKATGEKVADIPADLPKVTLAKDGKPSIDMNGYKGSDSLISQDLIKGKGAVVKDTQSVVAHYTGWLLDGTQFDSSWDRGQSSAFSLDSVIKGWKQGLAGHTVGSQVLLVVPPSLGYGNKDQEKIPANSTLVFVVDILAAY